MPQASFLPILQRQQLGKTGETYAFDQSGIMLTNSRFYDLLYTKEILDPDERTPANLRLEIPSEEESQADKPKHLTLMAASATKGESGNNFSGYSDYAGQQVVGAWIWDKQLSIGIATEQNLDESHELYSNIRIAIIFSILLASLLLVSVGFVSQRSHKRVNEARDKLKNIVDTATDGIVLLDRSGFIRSTNPAIDRLFGYKQNALLGQNINILTPELSSDQLIQEEMTSGLDSGREIKGLRQGGDSIPLLLTVNSLHLADGLFFSIFLKDLSQLIQAESALKDASEELSLMALVAEKTDNAVIITDKNGCILWCNPGFTTITGYSLDEVKNRKPGHILQGPDTNPQTVNKVSAAIRAHQKINAEILNYRKNGSTYWVNLEIVPILDNQNHIHRFMALERDITQQKQSSLALERAKSEAEHANRAKSIFLATMSHEIRTPLNGIVATMDMLRHKPGLSDEHLDLVQTACNSSHTLTHVIDDILDFSKIEAGKIDIEKRSLNLDELLNQVGDSLAHVAKASKVELLLYCSPEISWIEGDLVRLKQVLLNLTSNAIKFSKNLEDRQGRVMVKAEPVTNGGDNKQFQLTVTDNGIGMNRSVIENLFNAFVQGETDTTRRFGGTGLGLVITSRLTELMDGNIEVNSNEGKGSEFRVTLPLMSSIPQQQNSNIDLSELSILGITDDNEINFILSNYLHSVKGRYQRLKDKDTLSDTPMPLITDTQHTLYIFGDPADREIALQLQQQIEQTNAQASILKLGRGYERFLKRVDDNILEIDINNMRRDSFINAVMASSDLESPLLEPPLESSETTTTAPQQPTHGTLVLLADDNETNQKVISQQLQMLGYAVDIASNGQEALTMWHKKQYKILLTDCHMPVMDGYQLASLIRKEETQDKRTPIIAITADALKGTRDKCLSSGMDDYITKPIQLDRLKACLDNWMRHTADTIEALFAQQIIATQQPEIDGSALQQLLDSADEPVLRGFYKDFLKSSQQITDSLLEAHHQSDRHEVGRLAHKLKSSARMVGANALSDCCISIEQAEKANDLDTLSEKVPELVEKFSDFKHWAADRLEQVI